MGALQSKLRKRFLRVLRNLVGPVPVGFAIGREQEPGIPASHPVLRVRDIRTVLSLLADPDTAFGEGYSTGAIVVEGSLLHALAAFYAIDIYDTRLHRLRDWLLSHRYRNGLRGSRANIHDHYDLSNDFYRLWLDREMVYTCAYYESADKTLEAAQVAKMDHICRKLWLRPGEFVVEVGCGWGALALFMARNYGVRVRAFNISHEQIDYARRRAHQEGLHGRVEFIEDDYRNTRVLADAFVSVGMLEHVGREHYAELGAVIQKTIGVHGRGLLHFIGRDSPRQISNWIRKCIFPGAYAPSLRESLEVLEPYGFSVMDVENLRTHYAATLIEWLRRYEDHYADVIKQFGEGFARTWRLYLAGSYTAFETGCLQLFQVTFAGARCASVPWTRRHLYSESHTAEDAWSTGTY